MRYLIAIVSLVAVLGTLATVKASQISKLIGAGKAMQKAGPPPEVVSTTTIQAQAWEGTLTAVGSVVADKGVALSSDVPGVITRLLVESGAVVKKGQILLELDSNVERAQLESIRARKELADTSLKRSHALVESGALAPAQLDIDTSAYKGLTADARALEAQIARKVVRAPFSGRLGIRAVNLGQFLAPGTTIAILEATQTVFVDFTLPQQQLTKLKTGMVVRTSDTGSGSALEEGVVTAIEPAVDLVTRTVKLRASIPNQAGRLRTGMFVKVAVLLPDAQQVLAIPATAVVHATYGDSVFLVENQAAAGTESKPGKVARQQFVRIGTTRGDFVSVLDGVKAGEEVVSAGAFKLRNGLPLTVNNDIMLEPKLAPELNNR